MTDMGSFLPPVILQTPFRILPLFHRWHSALTGATLLQPADVFSLRLWRRWDGSTVGVPMKHNGSVNYVAFSSWWALPLNIRRGSLHEAMGLKKRQTPLAPGWLWKVKVVVQRITFSPDGLHLATTGIYGELIDLGDEYDWKTLRVKITRLWNMQTRDSIGSAIIEEPGGGDAVLKRGWKMAANR